MTTWIPLESNPDVLNKYIHKLGVPENWEIIDVCGLDPEMLEWIPKPVKAIIFLFPCSDADEKHRSEEDVALKSNPQVIPDDLFYMKQIIRNACGTIALVHGIANTDIPLNDGVLKKYLDSTKGLSFVERGKILEADSAFTEVHQQIALEGQTVAPNLGERVDHHFIALVHKNGELYELDGSKSFPIKHGPTTEDGFLSDAALICQEFMARDPEAVRFTVMAITPRLD